MDNNKKLELTLCGMLPYGLKMQLCDDKREDFDDEYFYDSEKFKFGAEWELVGYNYTDDLNIPLGEGQLKGMLLRNDMTYVNFKHYVLPKLHSLDKLTEPILDGGLIPIVELAKISDLNNDTHELRYENNLFVLYNKDGYYQINDNNFYFIEKLKEWHFNIYDLPKEMYIEKSKVKI